MINNGHLKLNSNSWVSSLIIADIYQINSAKIWCHDWGNYMNVSWAVAKGNPICSAVNWQHYVSLPASLTDSYSNRLQTLVTVTSANISYPVSNTRDHLATGSHKLWCPSACSCSDPWLPSSHYYMSTQYSVGRTLFYSGCPHQKNKHIGWLWKQLIMIHIEVSLWAVTSIGYNN